MEYLKAYWRQVVATYRTLWSLLFVRKRDLDGPLAKFNAKPGLFWEVLQIWGWLWVAILKVGLVIIHLIWAHLMFLFSFTLLLFSPAFVLAVWPIFTYRRWQHVRRKGLSL